MQFSRIAQQNTYQRVATCTQQLHQGQLPSPEIEQFFKQHGLDIRACYLSCLGQFDAEVYNGTIVAQDRKVYEFFIDTANLDDSDLDDVSDTLGIKDPSHPQADLCDLITMSLHCYDHDHSELAQSA